MLQEGQEIGRELFGYKKEDVDRLLAELHCGLRSAKDDSDCRSEEVASLKAKLEELEGISGKLKTSLEDAEKTSDSLIKQAQAEADAILHSARHSASRIIVEADGYKNKLTRALDELKSADQQLHDRFKATLESYLSLVEAVSKSNRSPEHSSSNDPGPTVENNLPSTAGVLVSKPEDAAEPTLRPTWSADDFARNEGSGDSAYVEQIYESEAEITLSAADTAIAKAHMSPIADIDGVLATWLFDNQGALHAYVTDSDVPPEDLMITLRGFSSWAHYLAMSVGAPKITLAFVQLKELILIIQPVNNDLTLGVVASSDTNIGRLFTVVSERRARLSEMLSGSQ